MKRKRLWGLGLLCGVLVWVICTYLWFVEPTRNVVNVKRYSSVLFDAPTADQPPESKDAPEKKRDVNDVQWARDALMKRRDERQPEDTPEKLAYKKALESPAFAEYQKKQNANFPSFDLSLWWDFLESQGLSSGRMAQEANFRDFFPTGEYVDYDPEMRRKLAEIYLGMAPPDSTREDDVEYHTLAGMMEFRKDTANLIWMRGRFNGYKGDLDWAREIQQNAASIVAAVPEPAALDPPNLMDLEPPEVFSDTTEVPEENSLSPTEREDTAPLEVREEIPQSQEALESEIVKDIFADIPNFPSEADFQQTLREHFSPQRFNTAMRTLSRYGPEEGLRRLKDSDPEIATHMERLIQPNKDTD